MKSAVAALALLLLAGCHHPHADQPDPGADGEAQARTAAKTLDDLKAADAAAQSPLPVIAPVEHQDTAKPEKAASPKSEAAPADDTTTVSENEAGQ